MENASRLIKKDQVRPAGSCQIGQPALKGAAGAAPQVRVVEQTDKKAVLEITCVCHQKIYVECAY
jgi:hypothetical protein